MEKLNLLLLEDDEFDIFLIKKILEKAKLKFEITTVSTEEDFTQALQNNIYHAILSDNSLPQFNATNALKIVKNKEINIPFILVTGTVSEEFAVEIMKDGAWDYVLKDRLQRLPNAVLNAINKHKLETEYQRKLNDIIKNEALMKEAERLARFGSWEVDLITEAHRWSDENYRILGYEVGEVTPSFDNFLNRVHPEDLHHVQKTIDDLFEQLSYQKYFCRVITKDNAQLKHIECEIFITQEQNGEIVRFNGFTRDISDRRLAEMQIIESEKKYQHLFENNPIPAWIIGSDFRFLDVNKAAIKNYGYTYDEFLSMTAIDIRPDDEKDRFISLDRKNINISDKGFWKHKKKNGAIIEVEINVVEINFEGRKCKLIIANDITEKKEAEEALIQSEANLRLIMDLLPQSISVRSFEGEFLFTNKRFAAMYGTSPGQLVGATIRNMIPAGNDPADYLKRDKEVILSNEMKVMPDATFTDNNGDIKTYTVTKVPFTPAGKKEKAVLGIGTDITERKNAEAERAKMTADIVQRNIDLEQFSYIVSHSLRAPLANLLGIADLVKNETLTVDEKIFLLHGFSKSLEKLDSVIIDLNQVTQIKHSVNDYKEEIHFSKLLKDIIANTDAIANNPDIAIKGYFNEFDTFYTVSNYIHSIFYNLITNSIKYKRPDTPLICEIKSIKQNDNIQLLFKDNGLGIDLKKSGDQVFELYKRFHLGAAEGKGMGLFMVKTHVESLGGKISVSSEVNKGTEFTIELPLPSISA